MWAWASGSPVWSSPESQAHVEALVVTLKTLSWGSKILHFPSSTLNFGIKSFQDLYWLFSSFKSQSRIFQDFHRKIWMPRTIQVLFIRKSSVPPNVRKCLVRPNNSLAAESAANGYSLSQGGEWFGCSKPVQAYLCKAGNVPKVEVKQAQTLEAGKLLPLPHLPANVVHFSW